MGSGVLGWIGLVWGFAGFLKGWMGVRRFVGGFRGGEGMTVCGDMVGWKGNRPTDRPTD